MRRRKNRTGIGIIVFVVLNICGIVAYGKIGLESRKEHLEGKVKILDSQLQEEEERSAKLKNMEAYVQTKKYIEEIAREKLGLVYEEDILFQKEE